jgi:cation diffusion facilitator family transporter
MQNQKNNQRAMKKLVVVVLITTFFVGVEVIGGMFANSIAILSDAAHLTSDALSIGISIVALRIGERDSNEMYSYGFHRAEILGALVSILFIWVISIWLIVEATDRLLNPREVDGLTMLEVSVLCLIFNLIQMSILHSKDLHDHAHGPG